MIFFNIKPVREFLVVEGHVYTLRSPRRTGIEMAVHGTHYYSKKIFMVSTELVIEGVTSASQLREYAGMSGLTSAEEWFRLALKLSGVKLNLYHCTKVE